MADEHVVEVWVENYHGLSAVLRCVGHEDCGLPEMFGWDSAANMENYHGEPIRFSIPARITSADEDSGVEWEAAPSREETNE